MYKDMCAALGRNFILTNFLRIINGFTSRRGNLNNLQASPDAISDKTLKSRSGQFAFFLFAVPFCAGYAFFSALLVAFHGGFPF